jgi:hypothetical protein
MAPLIPNASRLYRLQLDSRDRDRLETDFKKVKIHNSRSSRPALASDKSYCRTLEILTEREAT